MARMHPEHIEGYEKATEGEKNVFRFIRQAARPHNDFICWYQPQIGPSGKEPDFILFGKKLGLLVIEVKDWGSKQIISYTPRQFTVRVSGKVEKKTSPSKQARGYVHDLMDRLKTIPDFLSHDPAHEGGLKVPIGRMVAFPNISRHEYCDRGLHWLIPHEIAMLRDDLDAAGEIVCDESGRKFSERISGAFPFRFRGLTPKETEALCFVIWPESKIDLPEREGAGKARFQREVLALDEAQARVALRLGPGHHVIKGPPGSGKTLVLVYRCCHLYKYNPKVKRILLVCFNIALVSYLKRMIQDKGLGLGESGIHVFHFFDLCSKILGEPVRYENEERDYYDLVIQETLERVVRGRGLVDPFDAVLIDEGQDFSQEMMKVLLAMLRPGGNLIISLDSYQDLYTRSFSWSSIGIKASGRTHHLKRAYRSTVEIYDFSQRFIGETRKGERQLALLPEESAFHGPRPEMHALRNVQEMEDFLVRDIRESADQEEYRRSEIAIIYDDKIYRPERFDYDNRALPMRILRRLETAGIPATWVSQDVRAKEMYDITTDRVSLISIHSSKGLDFDLVYLAGIDHIHPTESTLRNLISLVYVAMTRAKYRLVIPYVEETVLIRRMKDCLPM